jgi:exopolyphosphatase/guanosine-5'-triphosphate,3'-diphosphate pyrophosphatase
MANLVRYHRKRSPRRKDPGMAELDDKTQQKVVVMSAFLRLAETLDRSHANLVRSAQFVRGSKNSVVLEVSTDADVSLEVWGVENNAKAFKQAFDRELSIEVKGPRNDYGIAAPSWTS